MTKIVSVLLPVLMVVGLGVWAFKAGWFGDSKTLLPKDGEIVMYWGTTCPHCKIVKEWMAEKKIAEKVDVVMKEVYEDKTNQKELMAVAQKCGIAANNIGVPLLYTDGKCMVGTEQIQPFLSQKAGLSENASGSAQVKEEGK